MSIISSFMYTYISHLAAIGASMLGGVFLLLSDVSWQMLRDPVANDARTATMHSIENVLSPDSIEGGRLYTVVDVSARPIRFMIDTGASHTVLTASDAEQLGFRKSGTVKVATLGGEVQMLKGRVPSMKVGGVTLAEVDVLVSGQINVSLLGVDTLNRLGTTHLSIQPT